VTMMNPNVVSCGNLMPMVIGPQTRICNITVSTGNSVYFAFVLADNAQLNDLQFGISVQAKNATSLDPTNFISFYVTKDACPSPDCPKAQNAFQIACGYDRYVNYNSISSVTSPLKTLFRNSVDGIYYIQVLGPTQGSTGAVTILFDIEMNDGDKILAGFVSVIAVPLFCFVFAVIIILVFFWKKTHGGWQEDSVELPREVIVVPDKPRAMSNRNLLERTESRGSVNVVSLDSVVNLFREQTAAINRLSETGAIHPDTKVQQNGSEVKEEVREVEMKRTFVVPAEESDSSASETEEKRE